jgi:hypothetical protein
MAMQSGPHGSGVTRTATINFKKACARITGATPGITTCHAKLMRSSFARLMFRPGTFPIGHPRPA